MNFIVGSQASDDLWDGNLSKFAPNGKPLSPATTRFRGGGIEGPGFGTAIDASGRVWLTGTGSKTISLFDNSGNPLFATRGCAYNRGMMGYRTPNIDRIADEGAIFSDYYGKQSCTAGRAAFVAGQSPLRIELPKVVQWEQRHTCRSYALPTSFPVHCQQTRRHGEPSG